MMFNMLKAGPNETPAYNAGRVNAYLGTLGLSIRDKEAFWSVLKTYSAQADDSDQKLQAASAAGAAGQAPPPAAVALFNQRMALVPQAQQALFAALSPAGAVAVTKHINDHVKPRTVMPYPK